LHQLLPQRPCHPNPQQQSPHKLRLRPRLLLLVRTYFVRTSPS
jgi:hypothetical protein